MMDTKEALKELEDLTVDYGNRNEEQITRLDEAIDMAIEALKTQADGDTISRRDAIDYCHQLINVEHQQGSDEMNYGRERVNQTETILHHLEIMPPAQPETHEKRTETHACDLISRQAAIDAMNTITKWSLLDRNGYHVGVGMKYRDVKETVKNLPPSPTLGRQAEPQTTEWLMGGVSYINEESVYCSKCRWAWSKKEDLGFFEYCPNCGRKILYRGKWRKVSKNESQGGAV